MKKTIVVSVTLFLVFSFAISMKVIASSPKYYEPSDFIVKGLPETVYVGQMGKEEFVPKPIEGIDIEANVQWQSFDPSILNIDKDGNWEALAQGYASIYVLIEYSEKTKSELAAAGYIETGNDGSGSLVIEVRKVPMEVSRLYNNNNGEHFYTTNQNEISDGHTKALRFTQ